MVGFDYAFYHIERTVRMALGDEKALGDMDISADGFWRSFAAILYAFPAMFFAWVTEARELIAAGSTFSKGFIVATSAVLEILIWLLPILILAFILRSLGFEKRFSHLVIARNWFSVSIAYLFAFLQLPSLLIVGYAPPLFLILGMLMAALFFTFRIMKMCLQSTTGLASGLVIGEFVFSIILTVYLQKLFGYY